MDDLQKLPPTPEEVNQALESVGAAPLHPSAGYLTFEELQKVELRVGLVISAEDVPKSNKMLKLLVDFGEGSPRTVLAGVGKSFAPEDLTGKQFLFVTNLAPRKMMGVESQGMILAVGDSPGVLSLFSPNGKTLPGAIAR